MGKILKNGIEYTPDANTLTESLTSEEYHLLSDAEKMSDTYYFVEDETSFNEDNAVYGYTPIGTIIHVMGNHAPKNYLVCNGQVINIVDYPELAQYFEEEFGAIDKFGGDGVTTFAVPDLRGEFLRGTGTNSHTDCGNGASVGTHQNGTIVPNIYTGTSVGLPITYGKGVGLLNSDKGIGTPSTTYYYTNNSQGGSGSVAATYAQSAVRPTNTSVLYCIAYKNIYITPENLYSTDEKVVGEWIDGKPLYQRAFIGKTPTAANTGETFATFGTGAIYANAHLVGGYCTDGQSYRSPNSFGWDIWFNASGIRNSQSTTSWLEKDAILIVQYTKTTD